MKDLTVSKIERLNVLNNRFAIEKIQKTLDITGMMFDGEYRFTKKMVADFYEVEERTIERYLENFGSELSGNGYVLCKGKRLKDLKLQFAPVINVGSKTTQLGLFNFRSFLNIGMLLTESEKAKALRSAILDIVIATINEKTGGGTKYINRRDVNYIPAAITEENYRKNLTSAMSQCVGGHKTYKYAHCLSYLHLRTVLVLLYSTNTRKMEVDCYQWTKLNKLLTTWQSNRCKSLILMMPVPRWLLVISASVMLIMAI